MLSLLIFLPIVFALAALCFKQNNQIRIFSLVVSSLHFVLSLVMLSRFDANTAALQMVEKHSWIPQFGISYFLGIDGISLWLVILTNFLVPVIILASWNSIDQKVKAFHSCLFVLQTAVLGTFLSIDVILFYCFWELSLIPMYFMIGIWGGARRIYATVKFFIFTMFGSVLMLVAILALMFMAQEQFGAISANLLDLYKLNIPFIEGKFMSPQSLMFFAFALAFAIKVPMFPLHTWLPDAHTEAPTPGSVILAGVMLKMGTYGFMRFTLPLFPDASQYWAWLFLFLGVIGIVYGALVAMVQPDIKKLVAYSSVSHMGYIMIGIFALNTYGLTGGLYQMLNHGISTGALFILVGMIYERTHSREISDYGGLAMAMPIYTICFIIITMSSIAVPMTNGFIGEYLILMGSFMAHPVYGAIAVLGVVLGAAYMLWMVKKVFFGMPGKLVKDSVDMSEHDAHAHHHDDSHAAHADHAHGDQGHKLLDLNKREIFIMTIMIVVVFWMGLYPQSFLNKSAVSIEHLSSNLSNYSLSIKE